MKRIIGHRTAANVLLMLFSAAVLFQLVVLSGFIPTEMVWGGKLESEEQRTVMSLVSLALLLMMIATVLIRMGRIGHSIPAIGKWGMWAIVVLFALNTMGNLAAEDLRETFIFTPVTLVAALLAWRVAIGE
jgi:archaellum biogenesis protein FlaJ (TadC family)